MLVGRLEIFITWFFFTGDVAKAIDGTKVDIISSLMPWKDQKFVYYYQYA